MADQAVTHELELEIEGECQLTRTVIEACAHAALSACDVGVGVVAFGVQCVSEAQIAELNLEHRQVGGATDVLSFPIDGVEELQPDVPRQLGDVVVCPAYVAGQLAQGDVMHEADRDLEAALRRCIVHGLLHLLGEDHEGGAADAARMFALEQQVLDHVAAAGAGAGAGGAA